MVSERFPKEADNKKNLLPREKVIGEIARFLKEIHFDFDLSEKDRASISIIGDKKVREKAKQNREAAIQAGISFVDAMIDEGEVDKSIDLASKAELVAEAIKKIVKDKYS